MIRSPRTFVLVTIGLLCVATTTRATTTSPNTGSLGAAANGTNADAVTFGPGPLGAAEPAAVYNGAANTNTVIPFQSALNPAAQASAFTVEFWANPTASDNDDAVLSNRIAAGNRSGWIFFQRAAGTGWNFRMYNGNGSAVGYDLTGGTANLNQWSHVVATWNGDNAATLYVNGQLADSTNDSATPGYNASTSATFTIGTNEAGTSTYVGSVDETAFYTTALSPAQILAHYNAALTNPAAYQQLVRTDGALLQLSNVPEPASLLVLTGAGAFLIGRYRRQPRLR